MGKLTPGKILFCCVWIIGLGCITAILLGALRDSGGFPYFVALYGVGVLWFVFLVLAFGPPKAARITVIPKRFDKAILFLVLAAIFVALLAESLRMLIGLRVFAALLLGLVSAGIFNVLRSLLTERDT